VSGCLAGSGESSDRSRNRGATGAEEAHKTPTERQRERKVDEAFSFLLRYHGGWWRRPSASSVAVVVAQSSVARCMQRVRSISTIEPATRLLTHKTSEAHFQDAQGHSSSLCGHLPRERERERTQHFTSQTQTSSNRSVQNHVSSPSSCTRIHWVDGFSALLINKRSSFFSAD
jgi:hypothetical protein